MPSQTHSTMKVYRLNIREGDKQFTNKEHQPVSTLCGQQCSHTHWCGLEDPKKKKKIYFTQLRLHVTQIEKKETNIYSYMSNK